jgi:hypothetical protein
LPSSLCLSFSNSNVFLGISTILGVSFPPNFLHMKMLCSSLIH